MCYRERVRKKITASHEGAYQNTVGLFVGAVVGRLLGLVVGIALFSQF